MSQPTKQKSSRASGANALIALLTFVLITGAALYGVVTSATLYGAVPDPVPASAPPTEFSSGRALEHVRAIAREPHPMGSPENAAVRDYLVEELSALGLEPEVQKTTAAHYFFVDGFAEAGTPENVLARLEGTNDGGKAFLLMAHYDSVSTAPGASDDGAGVAAMLETLRALKAGPPLKNDVIFLFTDGEERGLLGARAFVDSHPWAEDVGVVLNLEARGNTGPAIMVRTNDENGWLVREFAKAAPYPFATSDTAAFYEFSGSGSDLSVFMDAGLAGMDVAHTEGHAYYHTPLDNPEELDERSLQHMGSYALALTRHFGNVSLDHTKAPDEVYFNVFGFMVHYPEGWAVPLMAFAVLLFVAVAAFGFRRRRLTLGGVGLGFLALLGSMIVAALGVYLLWALIHALHPGGIWALQYKALLIWTGFAGLSVAITAALYVGFRKKVRVANLAVGALLWWLLLTVATGVSFPPASYLFIWPLLFSLLGLGVVFALGDRTTSPWFAFAALTLGAIPAVFLFASAVYGVTATQRPLVVVGGAGVRARDRADAGAVDPPPRPRRETQPVGLARRGRRPRPGAPAGWHPHGGLRRAPSQAEQHPLRAERRHQASHLGRAAMRSRTPGPPSSSGPTPKRGRWPIILAVRQRLFTARRPRSSWRPRASSSSTTARATGCGRSGCASRAPPKANVVVVEADAEAQVVGAAVNGKRLPEEPSTTEGYPRGPSTIGTRLRKGSISPWR